MFSKTTCIDCGAKIVYANKGDSGRCRDCTIRFLTVKENERLSEIEAEVEAARIGKVADIGRMEEAERAAAIQKARLEAIVLTTETVSPFPIVRRVGIVSAECVFGLNIFKDIAASFRDLVGGRSETLQRAMKDSTQTVLQEIRRNADDVGANAVVAVKLQFTEVGGPGTNMVLVVATGTAVVAELSSESPVNASQ